MTASNHAQNIRDYLQNNTNLSSKIVAGRFESGNPDATISVRMDGGPQSSYMMDGGDKEIKNPRVQIIVRGSENDKTGTASRANTVYDTLSGASPPGYMAVYGQSGPHEMSPGEDGQVRYSANFRLSIEE